MPEPKCSHAEFQIHVLRGLLHYHERMMMGHRKCPCGDCEASKYTDGDCPTAVVLDAYSDALKEAIRCIEIVHKDELTSD